MQAGMFVGYFLWNKTACISPAFMLYCIQF